MMQPSPYSEACPRLRAAPDPIEIAERVAIAAEARDAEHDRHRRDLVAGANALAALARLDRAPTPEELVAARVPFDRVAEAVSPLRTIDLLDVDGLFAPLPPVPWLVPSLDMCPGAPTLFAGFGFSGKTLAAQSLALSVAAGFALWGSLSIGRRGRVVHLDYEQGSRLTSERYQRLARGADLEIAALRGQLGVAVLPKLFLSDAASLEVLSRACEGAALLIVDSLRASAPDVDENASDVRRVLDMLTALSERTGVVVVVIHHARKPSREDAGGARMAIRGSGAIFDACGSVLVFGAAKGEPVQVSHEKARTSGILAEDFSLQIEDVELAGTPRAGLRVRSAGVAPTTERRAERDRAKREELDGAVLAFVARNPGVSLRSVRANVDGTDAAKGDALERLKLAGTVEERPGDRGARTFWARSGGEK